MQERRNTLATIISAVGCIGLGTLAGAQGTPSPRPGLTAQQAKQAVEVAREALVELRKKTEGASKPSVDRREYIVGVELLSAREPERSAESEGLKPNADTSKPSESDKAGGTARTNPPFKTRGALALVTSYRYFDDVTVFATVDLGTGRIVNLEAAQHHNGFEAQYAADLALSGVKRGEFSIAIPVAA